MDNLHKNKTHTKKKWMLLLTTLCNWRSKKVILWCINCSRGHKLPHGNSRVSNERYQLVATNLSFSIWGLRQEAGLYICHFYLLLQLFFLFLQPILLITKLILLTLQRNTNSEIRTTHNQHIISWWPIILRNRKHSKMNFRQK